MRPLSGHKLKLLALGGLMALSTMFISAGSAFAAVPCSETNSCKPYFKVFGSDAFAGGWFTNSGTCDTGSSYYQDDQTDPGGLYGGILSYSRPPSLPPPVGGPGGASSQYGAFALGGIEGGSPKGFYSNGARSGFVTAPSTLTFANDNNLPMGGNFQSNVSSVNVRQSHCIPDYYSKKPNLPANFLSNDLSTSTISNIYIASMSSGGKFSLNGPEGDSSSTTTTIDLNEKITIYVDGSVYIRNNIAYQTSGMTEANVPKFTLVAKGSIYIDYRVNQLDGLYIAQPRDGGNPVTDDTGVIWTCHGDNLSDLDTSYVSGCTNRLIFNSGALIAKQVHFTRTVGDLAATCVGEDLLSVALGCGNIAEIINYSPAMVIGGGFFNPSGATPLRLESLISLPPTL